LIQVGSQQPKQYLHEEAKKQDASNREATQTKEGESWLEAKEPCWEHFSR
jgi:hypothetical protein